jgi:hypothetical protein
MFWLGSLMLVILAACGSGQSSGSTATAGQALPPQRNNAAAQSAAMPSNSNNKGQTQQSQSTNFIGPQYLIKSLKVSMEVNDTRQVANDLQNWLSNTDPRATSAGMDYEQTDNNLFNITMTFSVQASLYPQIQQYLGNYPSLHGGHLLSMTETVQDVTNTYVDTQSRLKTLRAEQTRLQQLMSQAQNLNDLLTIEQRLTDVQSQIESTEAQLNTLTSQVTFYPVTIVLQPVETATPPPPPPGWSAGQIFHDAIAASIAFGQGLVSFLIWLLAFSIYIVPIIAIVWFIRRWRNNQTRPRNVAMPKMPPFSMSSFSPTVQSTQQEEARTPRTPSAAHTSEKEAPVSPVPSTNEAAVASSTDNASSEEPATPTPISPHH